MIIYTYCSVEVPFEYSLAKTVSYVPVPIRIETSNNWPLLEGKNGVVSDFDA